MLGGGRDVCVHARVQTAREGGGEGLSLMNTKNSGSVGVCLCAGKQIPLRGYVCPLAWAWAWAWGEGRLPVLAVEQVQALQGGACTHP